MWVMSMSLRGGLEAVASLGWVQAGRGALSAVTGGVQSGSRGSESRAGQERQAELVEALGRAEGAARGRKGGGGSDRESWGFAILQNGSARRCAGLGPCGFERPH